MELLLIRHALPTRITAEESGGSPADPGLTESGREQAARLAAWLRVEGVDHVVSSPLRRATETAAPIAQALGLTTEIVDGLHEYDSAADSYIPIEEMRAENSKRWQAMVEGRWEDYGGEPPRSVPRPHRSVPRWRHRRAPGPHRCGGVSRRGHQRVLGRHPRH